MQLFEKIGDKILLRAYITCRIDSAGRLSCPWLKSFISTGLLDWSREGNSRYSPWEIVSEGSLRLRRAGVRILSASSANGCAIAEFTEEKREDAEGALLVLRLHNIKDPTALELSTCEILLTNTVMVDEVIACTWLIKIKPGKRTLKYRVGNNSRWHTIRLDPNSPRG